MKLTVAIFSLVFFFSLSTARAITSEDAIAQTNCVEPIVTLVNQTLTTNKVGLIQRNLMTNRVRKAASAADELVSLFERDGQLAILITDLNPENPGIDEMDLRAAFQVLDGPKAKAYAPYEAQIAERKRDYDSGQIKWGRKLMAWSSLLAGIFTPPFLEMTTPLTEIHCVIIGVSAIPLTLQFVSKKLGDFFYGRKIKTEIKTIEAEEGRLAVKFLGHIKEAVEAAELSKAPLVIVCERFLHDYMISNFASLGFKDVTPH